MTDSKIYIYLTFIITFLLIGCNDEDVPDINTDDVAELNFGGKITPLDVLLTFDIIDTTRLFSERQTLPEVHFLNMPPIKNQKVDCIGEFSCSAFATAYAARSYHYYRDNNFTTNYNSDELFSPEFVYNLAKGPGNCESGSTIGNCLDIIRSKGVCTWGELPYTAGLCDPSIIDEQLYINASNYKAESFRFEKIENFVMKRILQNSIPIIFSFIVDNTFSYDNAKYLCKNPSEGYLLNPNWNGNPYFVWKEFPLGTVKSNLPAHTAIICGWDDTKNAWLIMNSWGTDWGNNGYGWIDYGHFKDVVQTLDPGGELDMWVLGTTTNDNPTCSDGIQNGNETGVDCGGSCSPCAPVADFSAAQTYVEEGNSISFTDLSTGNPTSWNWGFEGGTPSSSSEQNPSVTYNSVGSFDVSLTVNNTNGSDTETKSSYINVSSEPIELVAEFSANSTTINEGQLINFTDLSSGDATSWNWTFEGGTPTNSTTQNPSVTYATTGTYNVSLTVTNANGSDTEVKSNYIIVEENSGTSTVTDIDGNVYNTVVIGTQEWMAENLKVSKYSNGDPIPNIQGDAEWSALETGAWVHYFNDNQYESTHGKLYNWFAVANSNNLCPNGWHIPTKEEFNILSGFLGGPTIAGGKMKEVGTIHWSPPNTGATNESGFSSLPGGNRPVDAFGTSFKEIGLHHLLWTVSEIDQWNAKQYILNYNDSELNAPVPGYGTDKRSGFSVRCIKN